MGRPVAAAPGAAPGSRAPRWASWRPGPPPESPSSGSRWAVPYARRPGSPWTPPAPTAACAAPRPRPRRRRDRPPLRGRRGRRGRRSRAGSLGRPAPAALRAPPPAPSPSSSATATASTRTPGTSSAPPCAVWCGPCTGTSAATGVRAGASPRRAPTPSPSPSNSSAATSGPSSTSPPRGPLVLVGHSMGGMTVMAFAELYPELMRDRVAGVAFVGTSAGKLNEVTYGLPVIGVNAVRRILPGSCGRSARRRSWSSAAAGRRPTSSPGSSRSTRSPRRTWTRPSPASPSG